MMKKRRIQIAIVVMSVICIYIMDQIVFWKRDLERVQSVSINFREYKVKNIEDIKYFKNTKTVWFSYISAYDGDNSIYEEEHVLDNIYLIKKFKYLEDLHLYHLKINEDIEAMFPDTKVFIE